MNQLYLVALGLVVLDISLLEIYFVSVFRVERSKKFLLIAGIWVGLVLLFFLMMGLARLSMFLLNIQPTNPEKFILTFPTLVVFFYLLVFRSGKLRAIRERFHNK